MMQSSEYELLTGIKRWLAAGHGCWLCTVTHTWGAAPRQPGAMMAFNNEGQQLGALSGGCIDDDLIADTIIKKPSAPHYLLFGGTPEEIERLQLPCGGTVGVLVEPVDSRMSEHIDELIAALDRNEPHVTRNVDFLSGTYSISHAVESFFFTAEESKPASLCNPLNLDETLLIIGANDVSYCFYELASWMGYQLILCDPRPGRLDMFREAIDKGDIVAESILPDEFVMKHAAIDPKTSVLALSHDPRLDDLALMASLEQDMAYIGALGSKRTSEKRTARLKTLGLADDDLARIHGPIGLDIKSKTPKEIAVSIIAQLTRELKLTRQG